MHTGTVRIKNISFVTIFIKSYLFIAFSLPPYPKDFLSLCPTPASKYQQSWAKDAIWRLVQKLFNQPTFQLLSHHLAPLQNHTPLSSNSCPFISVKCFFFFFFSAVYPNRVKKYCICGMLVPEKSWVWNTQWAANIKYSLRNVLIEALPQWRLLENLLVIQCLKRISVLRRALKITVVPTASFHSWTGPVRTKWGHCGPSSTQCECMAEPGLRPGTPHSKASACHLRHMPQAPQDCFFSPNIQTKYFVSVFIFSVTNYADVMNLKSRAHN